jgi:hypothetical protein
MMDWTDTYYRHMARLMTKHTWLYTEMVVDKTLIHNPDTLDRWLEFSSVQHPVVLQLGGSEPRDLEAAAALARPFGYNEINLNCGCPRCVRTKRGRFSVRMQRIGYRGPCQPAPSREGRLNYHSWWSGGETSHKQEPKFSCLRRARTSLPFELSVCLASHSERTRNPL